VLSDIILVINGKELIVVPDKIGAEHINSER
jgi:hypothetical protein